MEKVNFQIRCNLNNEVDSKIADAISSRDQRRFSTASAYIKEAILYFEENYKKQEKDIFDKDAIKSVLFKLIEEEFQDQKVIKQEKSDNVIEDKEEIPQEDQEVFIEDELLSDEILANIQEFIEE